MNYLALCQEIVSELGLSGGTGPSSVTSNSVLELRNVTRWIRDSALYIDNLWLDWKYLWCRYAESAVVGATTLPAPSGGISVRLWDLNKFRFRTAGGQWQDMTYYTRQQMQDQFDPDNAVPGAPYVFTINPDNSIALAAPLDAAYDFKGEFWRRPVTLAANNDTPLIPAEFHRIIVARAAVFYGNREDAPEIIEGMEAEYDDMLDKLQSSELEGFALRRSSTDRERQPERQFFERYVRG